MAVPSTNIKFSDIYAEANGSYTSGMLSMLTMSFFSYFAGPNGSNSLPSNNYGVSENTGKNRIYGLSYKAGPSFAYEVGDYAGITYFYDNTNFLVYLNATNNIAAPPPPPPPINNDLNINVFLYDDQFIYNYMAGGGNVIAGGGTYSSTISQTDDPIIYRGYWKVEIGADPNFGGGTVDIQINGNAKVTAGTINAGPTPTSFDSNTYGTEDVAYYAGLGGDGLYFSVTCQ